MGRLTFRAGDLAVHADLIDAKGWYIAVRSITGPAELQREFEAELEHARGIGHLISARHCLGGMLDLVQRFAEVRELVWLLPGPPGPVPQPPSGSVW